MITNLKRSVQSFLLRKSAANYQTRKVKRGGRKSYKPGTIGLSAVSTSIQKDYGAILSRRERRSRISTKVYYNGNGPIRVHHNIKPNKYAKRKHGHKIGAAVSRFLHSSKEKIRNTLSPKEAVTIAD